MEADTVFYLQLLAILILDMLLGDPRIAVHPVRFIGFLCTRFESLTRGYLSFFSERVQGFLTVIFVIVASLLSLWVFLALFGTISTNSGLIGACLICYFCTAAGDLVKHSTSVRRQLDQGNLQRGREAVAMMVGRDTEGLDEAGISRACIESVCENLVDGITAPLFWALVMALFAPIIGTAYIVCAAYGFIAYKAVNTMDSMFGYKNERYLKFGSFAAVTDDIVNFVPARLSGWCVVVAALLPGYDSGLARQVFLRDRLKSSSPNSAHTEAAAAGALGIRLGGESSYFGEVTVKPYLGDGLRAVRANDIKRANRLVLISAVLFYLVGFGLHRIITLIIA